MSTVLDFPNKRKEIAGKGNPMFVSDITNLTENLLQAMQSILGLNNTDFYIISGLDWTPGSPGFYSTGIVYASGNFYYVNAPVTEGQYLALTATDTLLKVFDDATSHNTYTVYYASSTITPGATPQFNSDMNIYRLNLKFINTSVAKPVDLSRFDIYTFTKAELTLDGTVQNIDISSLVPDTAKWALLRFHYKSSNAAGYALFWLYGSTLSNNVKRIQLHSYDINADLYTEAWIPIANQKVNYQGNLMTSALDIIIGGYM